MRGPPREPREALLEHHLGRGFQQPFDLLTWRMEGSTLMRASANVPAYRSRAPPEGGGAMRAMRSFARGTRGASAGLDGLSPGADGAYGEVFARISLASAGEGARARRGGRQPTPCRGDHHGEVEPLLGDGEGEPVRERLGRLPLQEPHEDRPVLQFQETLRRAPSSQTAAPATNRSRSSRRGARRAAARRPRQFPRPPCGPAPRRTFRSSSTAIAYTACRGSPDTGRLRTRNRLARETGSRMASET